MKIVPIFEDEYFLLSAHFEGEASDEFTKFLDNWADIEFLSNFFTSNEGDLNRPFWKGISIENAIIKTLEDAKKIEDLFIQLSEENPDERVNIFKNLFHPLTKTLSPSNYLEKKKTYGVNKYGWLRIYALKIGDDMYCVTGATIKLTDNMEERDHTRKELQKIEVCRKYLKEKGIIDEDGMIELLEFGDDE